ncbi:MAG: DegV family protein [Chloroflexi bacterium]|nr:DegV family protein [Chloroflexota bacterium]
MSARSVAIVTDSTAYMPKELLDEYQIHVVSNVVNWGTESYRDGVELTPTQFYERLKTDPTQPTTAVASLGEIRDVYAKAAATAEAVVGIHLSHKLSGTYDAAEQVRREMLADKRIEVVNSLGTAMATGFVVLAAARAAADGAAFEKVIQTARNAIPCCGVVFTVETLEYLRRGWRIGGAQAFIGNLMDVKPILELRDGRVEPVERARTKKKAVARVLELITERVQGRSPVRLATIHAAAHDEAASLLETAKSKLGAVEGFLAEVSPTVGVHTGPGTVGLAWCAGM